MNSVKARISFLLRVLLIALTVRAAEPAAFQPPASLRATYNFNPGWRFIREDVPDAVKPDFDDSAWAAISTPHTWNDVDSYRSFISHSGGDRNTFAGIGWYRKHFKLPASAKATRVGYQWMGRAFNPNFGGLNHNVWLTGYAQRSVNDWAGLGQAYPDWMHDYNAQLIRASHANYVRWMRIAAQAADVRACDRFGIVQVCPAGDKEGDPVNDGRLEPRVATRQWAQRAEVMRDTMIYFRNSPSILFWEAGNQVVTVPHLEEMIALRKKWDPSGGRVMGTRHGDNNAAATALTPVSEFYGVMVGQDRRTDELPSPTAVFRGYSAERRNRAPLIETEDFRDEAPRGIWDDFSPPHFGFKKGPNDTYNWNSETFCLAAVSRYHAYVANRIDNPDPAHSKWSGYASIYWSDSNADGRQQSSTVLRVSGKVDGVRLPKEAFHVYRVMQNSQPDLHLIGHWTYPAATKKTMYVVAQGCDAVELFVNGKSLGTNNTPTNGYLYVFPDVVFASGAIKAVATQGGKVVAQQEIRSAGEPKALKLTVHAGPAGLQADGSDVAFMDFEVMDAQGNRCPTDEARVDFAVQGPAIWRGGLNSTKPNSTNNRFLNTECGINRVAIRSTLTPGTITLTATHLGGAATPPYPPMVHDPHAGF